MHRKIGPLALGVVALGGLYLLLKKPAALKDRVQAGDQVVFTTYTSLSPEVAAAINALSSAVPGGLRFVVTSADAQSLQVQPAGTSMPPFMMARENVARAWRNGQELT